MPFLASTALPLRAKARLYSAWVCSIRLHGGENWLVKEDMIRLERNDVNMVT